MRVFQEVISGWKRAFSLQLTTTLVMSLCFTTIIVLGLIAKNIEQSFSNWGKKIEMSVYLAEDLNESDQSVVREALQNVQYVKSVSYLDKETAKTSFYDSFADMVPELEEFSAENPFLASFEIELAGVPDYLFSLSFLEKTKNKIQGIDGVEEVGYGKYWFESYAGLMRGINGSVAVIGVILSLASLLIVGNSIRALVYKRKKEVEILELIGATTQWIRMPFVLGGALMGGIAGLLSLIGSAFIYGLVISKFSVAMKTIGVQDQVSYLSLLEGGVILLVTILIGAIGSYICIRGINSGWSAVQVVEE